MFYNKYFLMSQKYLDFYTTFYESLTSRDLPDINYQINQSNLCCFIDFFPILNWDDSQELDVQLKKYLPIMVSYIRQFNFISPEIRKITNYLTEEKILNLWKIADKHYRAILEVISHPANEKEKKRLYLGILWFLIGYYICQVISKIEGVSQFPTMLVAAENKWVLFITSCFIFYDDILDLDELPTLAKQECLSYTSYFFEYVIELLSWNHYTWNENMLDIRKKYQETGKIISYPDVIDKVDKVLDVCWKQLKTTLKTLSKENRYQEEKEVWKDLIYSIQDLFVTEVRISKLSKEDITRQERLRNMLEKSQKSILVIWKCLVPDIAVTDSILNLTFRFSLLSQLLDDLNDREIDREEGNHTIFTGEDYTPEIKKTLLYIFEIRDYLSSLETHKKDILIVSNHLFNLLVFNYAVGKQESLMNHLPDSIRQYFFLDRREILKVRSKKSEYIKKIR